MHAEMAETMKAGKVIGGHYATPDLGLPFHGYAAGGAEDDHEGTRLEDAVARARQGMKVMLRLGSSWFDVARASESHHRKQMDSRHFLLCTDDSHSGTLAHDGHMDRVLRHVISQGVAPITAIQMMTLNTAEHFGVSRDMGQIAPGRFADIVLASDLCDFQAELVIAAGDVIAEAGAWQISLPTYEYPADVKSSVKLKRPLQATDFVVPAPANLVNGATVTANVIGVIENQAPTRHLRFDLAVSNSEVRTDLARDVCRLALVERHRGTGEVQNGFVHGFGFRQALRGRLDGRA